MAVSLGLTMHKDARVHLKNRRYPRHVTFNRLVDWGAQGCFAELSVTQSQAAWGSGDVFFIPVNRLGDIYTPQL